MSKHTPSLDASELWDTYGYNPLTGKLFLIKLNRYVKGSPYIDKRNYKGMCIGVRRNGKSARINYGRAVYAWFTGEWSDKGIHIDHINGDSGDNRIWNLRRVSVRENNQNRKGHDYPGAYWNKGRNKWQAQIRIGKTRVYLGLYTTRAEACAVYITECDRLGYAVLPEVRRRIAALQSSQPLSL